MSEFDVIRDNPHGPVTVTSLVQDLDALGVAPGMTLLVHTSLSKLGWVCGGPVAVIHALEQILTRQGTLVMPTHTGSNSEPSDWQNPPVPQSWWPTIRAEMPAYDPALSPTWGIGAVAECFRRQPGVLRSAHPQLSFAAWGKHADFITRDHHLGDDMGDSSPLGRIYGLGGHVLLMGVGFDRNTSLHLAEHRADWPGKRTVAQGSAMWVDGQRRWVTFAMLDYDGDDFVKIGEDYANSGLPFRRGKLGSGQGQLMPQPALVDFAARWISQQRGPDTKAPVE
jgi:aminoglycoside 3-N-acetyltransferase